MPTLSKNSGPTVAALDYSQGFCDGAQGKPQLSFRHDYAQGYYDGLDEREATVDLHLHFIRSQGGYHYGETND